MYNINIAIIGCGRMGQERARAAQSLGAKIIYFYDTDDVKAELLANSYPGSHAINDVKQLNWQAIDAIFICTPPFTRGELELLALTHNVHLFVEKPIGLRAEQLNKVYDLLKTSNSITAVGYMNRYRASVAEAKEILKHEKVLGLCGNWVCGAYKVSWWEKKNLSGGAINEQATHMIDLMRYLVGEVTNINAVVRYSEKDMPTLLAILKLSDSIPANLFYCCMANEKQIGLKIFTENNTIILDGWNFNLHYQNKVINDPWAEKEKHLIFSKEVEAFFKAIAEHNQQYIKSDLLDAYRTQQIVDAINNNGNFEINNKAIYA